MITVTDTAKKKIKQLLEKRGKGVGIRLGVKTTGCSGLAYTLEYVDEYTVEVGVTNFAQPDFVVLADAKSLAYIDGMIVDWQREGLNEGFKFTNPNERDRCGCGESFRVQEIKLDIENKVKDIIAYELGVDASTITLESKIKEDLGSDSLTMVEIVISIEDAFKFEIPDEEAENIITVGDAIEAIKAKLK